MTASPFDKKTVTVTTDELDNLIVGSRLRRVQLQKQAEELPKGTAKGIAWSRVDELTQLLHRLETTRKGE